MKVVMEEGINGEHLERVVATIEQYHAKASVDKGERITLVGVIARDPSPELYDRLQNLPGVKEVIRISSPHKEVKQVGQPGNFFYTQVHLGIGGNVVVGGKDLTIIAGPCSLENKAQIEDAASIVSDYGGNALRCGVKKWRTNWRDSHGPGYDDLKGSLDLVVEAGHKRDLPVVIEILGVNDIDDYVQAGVDCLQVGATNSENQELLYALASTKIPILYKRGKGQKLTDYFIWATKLMKEGKNDIILCERGVNGLNDIVRNTADHAALSVMRYMESRLPAVFDPSHSSKYRDLVVPQSLAAVAAGAQGLIVEMHPNPHVAATDGTQTLYPEQFKLLVEAANAQWSLIKKYEPNYYFTRQLEHKYAENIDRDRERYAPLNRNQ